MIYITGDLHGEIDMWKLRTEIFKQRFSTCTKDDYLIICGDFGVIWNNRKKDKKEKEQLDFLESLPFTVLFVDGNHDNIPKLNSFPVKKWNGGKVHEIRPTILHLMRGQIYTIEGHTFFTMGGATSIDKAWRVEGKSWWAEEVPSDEEFNEALDNLGKHNWTVDYVITHCAPDSILEKLYSIKRPDKVTNFLEVVRQQLSFKKWFFGHYHDNLLIEDKFQLLYDNIIPYDEGVASEFKPDETKEDIKL